MKEHEVLMKVKIGMFVGIPFVSRHRSSSSKSGA